MFPGKKKLDLIASMYHLNTIIFVEKDMISRFYSPKSFVLCLLTGFLQLGYSNFWSGQNAWSYKGGWGTVEAGWYIILFHQFNFIGSAFVCAPSEHASLYPFSLYEIMLSCDMIGSHSGYATFITCQEPFILKANSILPFHLTFSSMLDFLIAMSFIYMQLCSYFP